MICVDLDIIFSKIARLVFIDPPETNATAPREIIRRCSRRRLCRLLFSREIPLSFIGLASRRSSSHELPKIFIVCGSGAVGAEALWQSGYLCRGASHGHAVVQASGAFIHALDVEVPQLYQDSNGCLHAPAQFTFFFILLFSHVTGQRERESERESRQLDSVGGLCSICSDEHWRTEALEGRVPW
jgi:hypothetical protein